MQRWATGNICVQEAKDFPRDDSHLPIRTLSKGPALAQDAQSAHARTDSLSLKLEYMAPEQVPTGREMRYHCIGNHADKERSVSDESRGDRE